MKKINLYLDDLRDCPEGFVVARSASDALDIIRDGNVSILSLDHDLGEMDGELLETGYDLVKTFCQEGLRVEKIYIHTDNVVGRENMFQTLLGARKRGFIDSSIEIYHYSITINRYTK